MADVELAPASIFLRLGTTLVAYMMLIAHLLMVALVPQAKCSGDAPDIWVVTLVTALLALTFALVLLASRPLKSVVQMLRWGCVPVLILAPLALIGALPIFSSTTLGGAPICPGISAYSNLVWQQAWGPLQLGVIAIIVIQTTRYWLMAANQAEAARLGHR